ncbi:hypothetical protein STEG23_034585 [Scotinomys teguina]
MCRLSWFLDPGGWGKTTAVGLYFIFPGICALILVPFLLQLSIFCPFQELLSYSLECYGARDINPDSGYCCGTDPDMAHSSSLEDTMAPRGSADHSDLCGPGCSMTHTDPRLVSVWGRTQYKGFRGQENGSQFKFGGFQGHLERNGQQRTALPLQTMTPENHGKVLSVVGVECVPKPHVMQRQRKSRGAEVKSQTLKTDITDFVL